AVEVGDEQVGGDSKGRQVLGELEPLQSAGRSGDGKAFRLELIGNELARGGVVVDDEHAVVARRPAAIGCAPCGGLGSARQADGGDPAPSPVRPPPPPPPPPTPPP